MILFNPTQSTIILIVGIALLLGSLVLVLIREQRPLLKLVWSLIVLCIPVLGAAAYLLKAGIEYVSSGSIRNISKADG